MNIRQPKTVQFRAAQRLREASGIRKIMQIFCAVVLILCTAVTLAGYWLDAQMAGAGGLGGLGTRSLISTVQSILPFAHMLILMVLELGLLNAMLRIARGQYASAQSLRMGLSRFWGLVRCTLLRGVIYFCLCMASLYIAMALFMLTPLSHKTMTLLEPIVASPNIQEAMNAMLTEEAFLLAFFQAVLPMYILFGLLFLGLLIPVSYRLRVVNHVLIDMPGAGAFRILMESFKMTKGNCMAFFKLDLSFWWYHVLSFLAAVLCYGDLLMMMLGIPLPWSDTASSLIFYGVYLVVQTAIYYFLLPRVDVSVSLIYEAIRPKQEPKSQVLGNIFQM